MPITWSYNTKEEANAAMQQPELKNGTYWGNVIKSEIIKGGKTKEDGTLTKDFLKINIKIELNPGVAFAEATFFDTPLSSHMRRHFWESAGNENQISNPDESTYVSRRVQSVCKVETYTNKHGESKKKLVVTDFVGASKKQSSFENESTPEISADPFIKEEIQF